MRTVVVACLALAACTSAPLAPRARVLAAPEAPVVVDLAHQSCQRHRRAALPERVEGARQGSAVALARAKEPPKDGSKPSLLAYVADADSHSVHTVSVDGNRELVRTRIAGAPRQVLVLPDGRVVVTLSDGTRISVLEPDEDPSVPLTLLCEREVPAEPWGLALSVTDARLVVTSGWGRALTVFDAVTMTKERTVPLQRDPRSVLVDAAGVAFVSHLVGARMSVVDLEDEAADPTTIALGVHKSTPAASVIDMRAVRTGSQGYALAKVGLPGKVAGKLGAERVLAPMVSVDPGDAERERAVYYNPQFDGVPKETPIVSVVDPATRQTLSKYLLGVRPAGFTRECLLPRAATVRAKTASLFVTCFGIDSVLELDALAVDPFRAERRRIGVAPGPEGIAIDEASGTAAVFSQLGASLTVLHLDAPDAPRSVVELDYHPEPDLAAAATGRLLFYRTDDARITSDGLACASCHIDGRDDAITWTTPQGARQTPMLAGRLAGTAPYGWEGKRATLQDYISSTIANLGGSGLKGPELDQIASFLLASEGPPQSPRDVGELREVALVQRGHDLFESKEQGCSACHVAGRSTDAETHTLHSAEAFDTPGLHFIGGSAPYFHDGRYETLEALLSDTTSGMGKSYELPASDQAALAAYLRSL